MATADLTAARLRELLHYDPDTGVFTWRVHRGIKRVAGLPAGTINSRGYAQLKISPYGSIQGHRAAWLYAHGDWPSRHIDHINGNKADNRLVNLRDVTHSENQQNQRTAHRNNRVGLLGVSVSRGRYAATIQIDGANRHLGRFETAEEAHAAYIEAKRGLHGTCSL